MNILRPRRRPAFLALAFLAAASLQGCGFVGGASIVSSSVGSVTASGVERTFDGAAIKTFTGPASLIEESINQSLSKMGFDIVEKSETQKRIVIKAKSDAREVKIEIHPVARNAAKIRVDVDSGWILSEDPATASEILVQATRILEKQD